MIDYNSYFNLDLAIDAGDITREEAEKLVSDRRVFCTTVRMDRQKAYETIGGTLNEYPETPVPYGGHIVVSPGGSFEEAQEIADKRRLGETVDGLLFPAGKTAATSPWTQPATEKSSEPITITNALKDLLKEWEEYKDGETEIGEDHLSKVFGVPGFGSAVVIHWGGDVLDGKIDEGYSFTLPICDEDPDVYDFFVHIPQPDNEGGMGAAPAHFCHIASLLTNKLVKQIVFFPKK